MPNSSPKPTRTAGAVWNTTILLGSAIAALTSLISERSLMESNGQIDAH